MGYTHFWELDPRNPQFQAFWPEIVSDAQTIASHAESSGITLAAGLGSGAPVIEQSGIYLNGPKAAKLSAETFLLDPQPWQRWHATVASGTRGEVAWARGQQEHFTAHGFDTGYCETKRRPYDAVVCAILLRAHHLAPDALSIATTGGWDEEWRHGAAHIPGTPRTELPSARDLLETLFDQYDPTDPRTPRRRARA